MREILFKAKRVDNGEWVEGYLVAYPSGRTDIHKKSVELPDVLLICEVDSKTICQYTGLTDKNGNKIWENDIVGIYSDYRKEYDYGVVSYGEFNCSCCNGVYGWSFGDEDIRNYEMYEVKGNIFDNPEMIKK